MSLIHIYWIDGKKRRIVCHHYRSPSQWLIAASLPKPKKKFRRHKLVAAGNVPWAPMTPAQFDARRRALLSQLQGAKNCAL